MMSKLSLLSLFLVLSVYGQSRPTGNIIDPEATETEILAAVKSNMGMCSEKEVPINSMKELYDHLSSIQNKNAVVAISGVDGVANDKDPVCEKPKFINVSSEVTCLLYGVEESMYAFSKSKAGASYMEKKFGVSEATAKGMLSFMEHVNEPGFAISRKKKGKTNQKYTPPAGDDEGKI